MIGLARERYTKNLWSERAEGERPRLVNCEDEDDQAEYVIRQILEHREAGIDLRRQAVLFRASHHSMLLEAELARRNIPFHKYGGLKFVETAHVKDLMAFLRLAENPRDVVAGTRLLPLLPGIGPGKARQLMEMLLAGRRRFRRLGRVEAAGRRGEALAASSSSCCRAWPTRPTTCRRRSTACGSSTRRCWRRSTTTPSRGCATWSNWS